MDKTIAKWEIVTGRALLGLYFLVPGIMKLLAPDAHVALMEHHGIAFAPPLMWFAALVNIGGGLALISGRHVRLVAFGFVIYILLVNALLHDFWNLDGAEGAHEMQNFIKNLGILAGLLVLAGVSSPRALAVSNWWKSDRAA
jgi:putative oxidoreductase